MAERSTHARTPGFPFPTRPELLIRSRPASQTRASSSSVSISFFSSRESPFSSWTSSSGFGFGRQQWCPSSFITRIGIRSASSPRRSRAKASFVSSPLSTTR